MEMKELRKSVRFLIDEEWLRANETYSPFRNSHEAAGVLREEIDEAMEAITDVDIGFDAFWEDVKSDDYASMVNDLEEIYKWAQLAACECIQVGAMAEKSLAMLFNMKKGKKNDDKTIQINYEALDKIISRANISGQRLSELLGYSRNWYSQSKVYKRGMATHVAMSISYITGAKIEEFTFAFSGGSKEEPKKAEKKEIKKAPSFDDESEFEKYVRESLDYIEDKLKALHQLCSYSYGSILRLEKKFIEEEPQAEEQTPLPEIDRATNLLKQMLENVGGIKYEDYRAELKKKEHIEDGRMIEAAIAKLNYQRMSRGYGRNKVMWIVKPSAVQSLQK